MKNFQIAFPTPHNSSKTNSEISKKFTIVSTSESKFYNFSIFKRLAYLGMDKLQQKQIINRMICACNLATIALSIVSAKEGEGSVCFSVKEK